MVSVKNFAGCALTAALLLACGGCKSTYSEKQITAAPAPMLHHNDRIYVAMPFDATFKKTVAQGSGKQTAQTLFAALSSYTQSVFLGKFPESPSDALETARKYHVDYVVYPAILKWEDRATEWSGRRDKLELRIDLLSATDGQVAFSQEVEATGKWMTDGDDTPNDLLPQPCEKFVNALFRPLERPSAL
jgi:hypothetical protein